MKIAVLGASGRTGRLVVEEARRRGHHVVAVVRDPARLGDLTPDGVATADGLDAAAVTAALAGVDAVVSALGPVPGSAPGIQGELTRVLVRAARDAGVRRAVVVTASGWVVDGDDPLSRYLAKPILARALRDANAGFALAEPSVRESGLDWTIVRPPMLRDGAARGRYHERRDGNVRWRWSVRRADLAAAVCDLLADPTAVGATVSVAG
ncbi:NAD(P)-dependent oxidoreductase [Isoptericola sp. NPDC057391]|uniref:NAD(P)-dependent oxidoreductase n=1 Tax=Isoptericola sp. NPDC057391 TaxID=3346117 RepID=UPI003631FC5B